MGLGVSMFLTREELRELTGRSRPSAQIRWLRSNGFETMLRADRLPLVLRAAIVDRMCAVSGKRPRITPGPNWSALDAA